MICAPRVNGYALGKKMWVQLQVDSIREIKDENRTNALAFNNIVLPKTNEWKTVKDLIRLLVENHATEGTVKRDGVPGQLKDLVAGKGQGLVILLHGIKRYEFHESARLLLPRCVWGWENLNRW
jgi:hypothetical protein